MSDNDAIRQTGPTRREYVKYGGTIVGGSLLAGCTGGGSEGGDESNEESGTNGDEDERYTVELSPVGEVEFEGVPESAMVYSPQYVDMLVAYGHEGAINSINFPENFYTGYYEALEGVAFDPMDVPAVFDQDAGTVDKEFLYELDSDVHLIDPHWFVTFDGWDWDDIDEIEQNVGPFFANRYSRENNFEGDERLDAEEYEYYTAWELYGTVADAFRAEERWSALREIRDAMVDEIESGLPPEEERPSVGLVSYWEGEFSPYRILQPGFGQSQYHPLEPEDVFAESDRTYSENYEATYDFEGLLEFDPDVLIQFSGITAPAEGEASF
ncbi:MAG: ABC transporter substrate-binding protein, partial [Halalkalicoccus sp.]